MKENMNIKEKIAAVQKGMGALKKDTEAYNYKYVTLDQIQEKMNPLLEENGLLLTQPMCCKAKGEGGEVVASATVLLTKIQDLESEEILESSILLPTNVKPQDLGSAITYFRRYSLLSLFNLVTEDDDGAKAQGGKTTTSVNTANDLDF